MPNIQPRFFIYNNGISVFNISRINRIFVRRLSKIQDLYTYWVNTGGRDVEVSKEEYQELMKAITND